MNHLHKYFIEACMAKTELLAVSSEKTYNIGSGFNWRWPSAKRFDVRLDGVDYNTDPIPCKDGEAEVIICEQVIEHLHNTTWFISELFRICAPGGQLLISTENLASWPNLVAMMLSIAPFSTQPICGEYIGGWKKGKIHGSYHVGINHPIYSGISGHVRVMTSNQLKHLLERAGFSVKGSYSFGFGHYILFDCQKPKVAYEGRTS